MLRESKDPDVSECYENHRFGHWACGWFEILIVKPGSDCERIALEIEASLASYPCLDEMHYSELENEEWDQEEIESIARLSSWFDLEFQEGYDSHEGTTCFSALLDNNDEDEWERIYERAELDGLIVDTEYFDNHTVITARHPRGQ